MERLWPSSYIVTSVTQSDRSSGRPYCDCLIIVYLLRVRCKWHKYRDFSSFVKFFRCDCKQNNSNQKYFLCPELFIAVNFTSLPQTLPSLSGVFFQSYVSKQFIWNYTVLYMVRTLSGNLVKFKILKRSLNIDTRKCELIYKNCLQKINLKTVTTLHSCFGD